MLNTAGNKGRLALGAAVVGVALALSGCAQGDPLSPTEGSGSTDTIVVGSQAYYSNEIVAEIYAQALENAGYDVERSFQIGQRDAYLPALEAGEVDVFPEYTGNLLQYYAPDTTASDQDSYTVTQEFADANSLSAIGDLANVDGVVLGGPPELEERPYGPSGLESVYGVTVSFEATGDTTFDALIEGVVDVANIYTADPRIQTSGLVTLDDPEGLFLASNVVPLVNADLANELASVLDPVSAALTADGLIALNVQSVEDQLSSAQIATEWLTANGFLG